MVFDYVQRLRRLCDSRALVAFLSHAVCVLSGEVSLTFVFVVVVCRAKDDRQANVQLPLSAVEHMQALVSRSGVGGDSRVMDVGAGTGILLRFLQGAGVDQVQ